MNPLASPAVKTLLKRLGGAAAGAGLGAAENRLIYNPTAQMVQGDPEAKASPFASHMSVLLGALSGLQAANGGLGSAVRNYIPKVSLMSGTEAGIQGIKGFMRDAPLRLRTAELQRGAAADAKDTAATEANTAKQTLDSLGKMTPFQKTMVGLGAGGLGVYGVAQLAAALKSRKKKGPQQGTVVKGDPAQRRPGKVRIDVPAGSLPPEFFRSIIDADDKERALTTAITKPASFPIGEVDLMAELVEDLEVLARV